MHKGKARTRRPTRRGGNRAVSGDGNEISGQKPEYPGGAVVIKIGVKSRRKSRPRVVIW